MTADCLQEDTILAFAEGRLEAAAVRALESHTLSCPSCRQLLTAALGARWGTRGEWLAGAVTALLVIVLAEIVPKVIFREYPEPLTLAVTPAIRATMFVLAPARVVVGAWARLLRRLLPGGQTSGAASLAARAATDIVLAVARQRG